MNTTNLLVRLVRFLFGRPPTPSFSATVLNISDGDTVKVSRNGVEETVRLFGIDTPETAKPWRKLPGQPLSKEARDSLKAMLPVGSTVFVNVQAKDRYGRTVAIVSSSDQGPSANEKLLAQGLAWYDEYGHRLNPRQKERKNLQEAFVFAQSKKVGLWGLSWQEPPHEFRKRMKY